MSKIADSPFGAVGHRKRRAYLVIGDPSSPGQCGLGVTTHHVCRRKLKMQNQVGMTIAIRVLLVAARYPGSAIQMHLSDSFKDHSSVVHP